MPLLTIEIDELQETTTTSHTRPNLRRQHTPWNTYTTLALYTKSCVTQRLFSLGSSSDVFDPLLDPTVCVACGMLVALISFLPAE